MNADLNGARELVATAEDRAREQAKAIEALTGERDGARDKEAAAEARNLEQQEAMDVLRAEKDALTDQLTLSQSMLAQRAAEIDDALSELQAAREALAAAETRSAGSDSDRAEESARIRDLEAAIERRDEDLARMQILMLEARNDPAPREPAAKDAGPATETRLRRQSLRRLGSSPSPKDRPHAGGLEAHTPDRKMVNDLIVQRNLARAACEQAEFRNQAFLNSSS